MIGREQASWLGPGVLRDLQAAGKRESSACLKHGAPRVRVGGGGSWRVAWVGRNMWESDLTW